MQDNVNNKLDNNKQRYWIKVEFREEIKIKNISKFRKIQNTKRNRNSLDRSEMKVYATIIFLANYYNLYFEFEFKLLIRTLYSSTCVIILLKNHLLSKDNILTEITSL